MSIENHDAVLLEMIRDVGSRLFAVDVLRGLQKIDLGGFDFDAAKKMTQQARVAVAEHRLGYAVVCAKACEDALAHEHPACPVISELTR